MKWDWPARYRQWSWSGILAIWLFLTLVLFVATWMGLGNCTLPRCWGDPVSLADAKLPRLLVASLTAGIVTAALMGIRSGHTSK